MTTETVEAPAVKDRASSLLESRKAKMDELFLGKRFTILKEIHLEGDDRFETPFGNKGRHGYALQDEGDPSNKFIVGATMLQQISDEYSAVDVPVKERKRRTKEQKAADDAAAELAASV